MKNLPYTDADVLPNGWAESRLNAIASMRLGKMLDRGKKLKGKMRPYLRNINVRWREFDLGNLLEMDLTDDEAREFDLRFGDLLVCEGGEPGRSAIWRQNDSGITFQKALHRIRLHDGVLPEWVMYDLWRAASDGSLEAYFTGSTIKHLTGVSLATYRLHIAPLAEQRRIVAKVEELLARVNAARERLAKAPVILKRFRQSVLAAACSGQLTADWRPIDSKSWCECKLGELIIDGPQNGLYKPRSAYGTGTPIVRIADFYDGVIRSWESLERLKTSAAERDLFGLSNDDFLINRVNSMAYLGKSALVRDLQEPCVFESNMMRFRIDSTKILPEFLIRYLNSLRGLGELRQNAKHAINQSSINQQDVAAVTCPLPPITEQHEIVLRVKALLSLAGKIESRVQAATARVEKITQAILAKAFRGELVPTEAELARQEGRDYESASDLLERIRISRTSTGSIKDVKSKRHKLKSDFNCDDRVAAMQSPETGKPVRRRASKG